MVGFPGESQDLFEESFAFIAAQPYPYLHLFPFSARPGTRAWHLAREYPVPAHAVADRMARLRALIAAKNRRFRQGFLGCELPAVTLPTASGEATPALADNFLEVRLEAHAPPNQNVRVLVTGLSKTALTGQLAT